MKKENKQDKLNTAPLVKGSPEEKTSRWKGKNGKYGFNLNPQNINRKGRPRSSFSVINKKFQDMGVEKLTLEHYVTTLGLLCNLTQAEIEALTEKEETPLFLKLLVAEFTDPTSRGRMIKEMLEYLFNKSQKIEIKTNMTDEERQKVINEIIEETKAL